MRLWRLSGQRYQASPLDVLAATGRDYNMLDEFPEEYGKARAAACSLCIIPPIMQEENMIS